MKNITQIIAELSSFNHYKPLKNFFECERFVKNLRNDVRQNLLLKTSNIYIFNDTLVVTAKNNASLQDLVLPSNKKFLQDALKAYQKIFPFTALGKIQHIKYTLSKYRDIRLNTYKVDDLYTEHSDGEFDNIMTNQKAKQILNEIKNQIKKNIKEV